MKIDTQTIIHNIKPSIQEELKAQKAWWLSGFPYVIGATICKGLSEAAVAYPMDKVVTVSSQALNYSVYACVLMGAYKFWKALEAHNASIEDKKIEKVIITKEEFEQLKQEIDRLTTENADLTQRLG